MIEYLYISIHKTEGAEADTKEREADRKGRKVIERRLWSRQKERKLIQKRGS
jgi:hypothetical protein